MKHALHLTFLLLAIAACGGSEEEPADSGRVGLAAECASPCKAPELSERTFLLSSAQGFTPLDGTTPRLSFHDGRLGLSAGCNSVSGEFALRDGTLDMTGAATTLLGCDPARLMQDEWLTAFITMSPRFALDANTLTLTSDNATLVFLDREVADPDRPLVNTTWMIDSFISNDAVGTFPGGSQSTLWLTQDGTLRYLTGCGSGHASYTVSGEQLTLGEVGSGAVDCRQKPAAVEAEKLILSVLSGDGALTFDIQASRLTLRRGNVGLSALAREP